MVSHNSKKFDNTARGWVFTPFTNGDTAWTRPTLRIVRDHDGPVDPFAATWRAYHAAGYAPIPLPAGQKHPPPKREGDVQYTGEHGQCATTEKLNEWQSLAKYRNGNIGIAFCNTVTVSGVDYQLVGIDVDHYGDRRTARRSDEFDAESEFEDAPESGGAQLETTTDKSAEITETTTDTP
ncbi:hypothetical protein AFM11_33445 [Mycolicibacterium wolinskyi]|uniref:DNA primase/polymerase bifunctional N-terminal domain-containing protein n=1 Tax=Mycolicibacterium wolinskyi TaxID=59750 RepID=A0A132PC39_9MYCO|nr:bifunctional DNA primase/polymerase [Mycolicibacterium wolinskyi]KWX19886.1 hypothetical protein AFM11_33445 [Mycolicibacterium wolinskyi]